MKQLTVDLTLLHRALDKFWAARFQALVQGKEITVRCEDVFVFHARIVEKIVCPFYTTEKRELTKFLDGKAQMQLFGNDASGHKHIDPLEWLSDNGFDVAPDQFCAQDGETLYVRHDKTFAWLVEQPTASLAYILPKFDRLQLLGQ